MPKLKFGDTSCDIPFKSSSEELALIKRLVRYVDSVVDIFEVFSYYNLPLSGDFSHKMKCIFPENHAHGDRNLSAKINKEKNTFTCYAGCGFGGPIWIVQKMENVSIGRAAMMLNARCKLNLNDPKVLAKITGVPVGEDNREVMEELVSHEDTCTKLAGMLIMLYGWDLYKIEAYESIEYEFGALDDLRYKIRGKKGGARELAEELAQWYSQFLDLITNCTRRLDSYEGKSIEDVFGCKSDDISGQDGCREGRKEEVVV